MAVSRALINQLVAEAKKGSALARQRLSQMSKARHAAARSRIPYFIRPEAVAEHARHPDVKHMLSWNSKQGAEMNKSASGNNTVYSASIAPPPRERPWNPLDPHRPGPDIKGDIMAYLRSKRPKPAFDWRMLRKSLNTNTNTKQGEQDMSVYDAVLTKVAEMKAVRRLDQLAETQPEYVAGLLDGLEKANQAAPQRYPHAQAALAQQQQQIVAQGQKMQKRMPTAGNLMNPIDPRARLAAVGGTAKQMRSNVRDAGQGAVRAAATKATALPRAAGQAAKAYGGHVADTYRGGGLRQAMLSGPRAGVAGVRAGLGSLRQTGGQVREALGGAGRSLFGR